MSTRNVTITSKNQITLPSEYVKALHLSQSRVLGAEVLDGRIVLSRQPALGDAMKQFWGKHSAKHPLTNNELKRAIRTSSKERTAKVK
ncbi:MAG TPA: AbrB/MazE/SpoVT family DNA-binding domain-containing protein [Candidatus Dormibacteraeota bacterium]|nr:AbrB/MazE/SpoVT family DNA-binding domain-containing protein [Candidatus Dormibacteraeota bacterium]